MLGGYRVGDTPNLKEYWNAVARFVEGIRKLTKVQLPSPLESQKIPDVRWRYEEGKMIRIIGGVEEPMDGLAS